MGRTERLRGKGQSSFIANEENPDARGSEELFVTRGWLEALCLSGSCRRQEKRVPSQGPFPPEIALHTRLPRDWVLRGCRRSQGEVRAGKQGGWGWGRISGEDGGWEEGALS